MDVFFSLFVCYPTENPIKYIIHFMFTPCVVSYCGERALLQFNEVAQLYIDIALCALRSVFGCSCKHIQPHIILKPSSKLLIVNIIIISSIGSSITIGSIIIISSSSGRARAALSPTLYETHERLINIANIHFVTIKGEWLPVALSFSPI